MYFESHAHYDDKRFDNDRDELLTRLHRDEGVDTIINVGADMKSSKKSIELSEKYDFIFASVGVHPHDSVKMTNNDLDTLEKMANLEKVVAIGEIGLDFHYDHSPRDVQEKRFREQLELCRSLDMPVIIHTREADGLCFSIIKESKVRRGVIHCFSGSAELAAAYVRLGFMIGVGGVVTYSNARRLVEAVKFIPISSILIETDCPYLSPEPVRGSRNSSEYLRQIVTKISEIKQITTEYVALSTTENANILFSL